MGTQIKLKRFLQSVVLVSVLTFHAAAIAQQAGAELGDPTYSGDGCPRGSVNAVFSPDRRTLSLLFDEFAIDGTAIGTRPGGRTPVLVTQKRCLIYLPILVPEGVQARIDAIDFRGYVFLPNRTHASLDADIRVESIEGRHMVDRRRGLINGNIRTGAGGPFGLDMSRFAATPFRGPLDQVYTISKPSPIGGRGGWTPCGSDVTISSTNTLALRGLPGTDYESMLLTMDSIDVATSDTRMQIRLQWQPCQMPRPQPQPVRPLPQPRRPR